jgi:hypothetical protein
LIRSTSRIVEIETAPAVVLHVLKYIYTARFPDADSPAIVSELLRIAKQLQLQDLIINLMLRFNYRETSDRDCMERSQPDNCSNCEGEGEGNGYDTFATLSERRSLHTQKFLDSSKFEGVVTVNTGPYKFRRQSAVLLAARSTWFAERIDSLECTVDATAIPVNQVTLALRFVRMEGIEELSSFNAAFEAMHWSWVLGIHSLQSWVEHVIVTRYLNSGNVCQIWSSPACGEYLAERCMQFLQDNFLDCASSAGFLNLRHDMIKEALKAGRINVDTISIMNVLRRWADRNTSRPDEREQALLDLLPPNTMFNMMNRMTVLGVVDNHPLSCHV